MGHGSPITMTPRDHSRMFDIIENGYKMVSMVLGYIGFKSNISTFWKTTRFICGVTTYDTSNECIKNPTIGFLESKAGLCYKCSKSTSK